MEHEVELKFIVKKFGDKAQQTKAIEEMSELTKELCKNLVNRGDRNHIVEEMADTEIMLEQLKIIFGISEVELNNIKMQKIERTIKRINGNE